MFFIMLFLVVVIFIIVVVIVIICCCWLVEGGSCSVSPSILELTYDHPSAIVSWVPGLQVCMRSGS